MTPSAASFCRILNGGRRHRPDRHRRRQWRGRSGSAGCLWRGCWLRAPHPRGRHRGSADIGGGQDKLTERNVAGFAAGGHGGHFLVTGGREPSLALENPSQIALRPSSSPAPAAGLGLAGAGEGGRGQSRDWNPRLAIRFFGVTIAARPVSPARWSCAPGRTASTGKTRWTEAGAPAHRRLIRFPREALGSME